MSHHKPFNKPRTSRAWTNKRLLKCVAQSGTALAPIMHDIQTEAKAWPGPSTQKHLIVMANGLFGKPSNWDVVIEHMQQNLDMSQTLLVASNANSLLQVNLQPKVVHSMSKLSCPSHLIKCIHSLKCCQWFCRHMMALTAVGTG